MVAAFGFRDVHADWKELVARDDIDVVSVTGPNFIHRDVSVSVAESGKHLWVEKAGWPQRRGDPRDRSSRRHGRRPVGGRLQLPQRTGCGEG